MIKLYTKTVCPKCMVAKAMFDNNGIEYQAVNIDHDEESKQKLIDAGFMATPIVEHEGKFYTNMNEFQELVDSIQ